MKSRKIAIISDIHGNADALKWTLMRVALDSVEITVFLGDLLTYGCQPCEVLDLLNNYQASHKCVFIKGNHDQFYFDIRNKVNPYQYSMPEFVQESIEWTSRKIDGNDLESMFDWQAFYELDDIYFAHANPYKYGNWEYVGSIDQCLKASSGVLAKDKKIGIFGHSHRAKVIGISGGQHWTPENMRNIVIKDGDCLLLNPGSIGQSRGEGISYMQVSLFKEHISVELIGVDIDLRNSIDLINRSSMSVHTKEKLISYLRS